jgi:hypothetical protein
MILLLGYLASLISTFVISAAVLSAILIATAANKPPGHPYRSHVKQLSKHEPNKHRDSSRITRAAAKDKSASVASDAERWPEVGEIK